MRSKMKCYRCQKIRHIASRCRTKLNESFQDGLQIEDQSFLINTTTFLTRDETGSNWCLDSGCTTHLCRDQKSFTEITNTDVKKVNLANDKSTNATATGTVRIKISHNTNTELIDFMNVLHVPTLRTNLMSVAKITDKGNKVTFYKNKTVGFGSNGRVRLIADRKGDLYFVRKTEEHVNNAFIVNKSSNLQLWHNRLGHLYTKDVVDMS